MSYLFWVASITPWNMLKTYSMLVVLGVRAGTYSGGRNSSVNSKFDLGHDSCTFVITLLSARWFK